MNAAQEPAFARTLRSRLAMRAALLRDVREFMHARGVLEVDTALLRAETIPDPAIGSLRVYGDAGDCGYLQTSPEFAMKALLAAGSGDIYQLGHVFRDGEHGRHHRREFTLLEWYRCGYDEHALMDEVVELLVALVPALSARPVRRVSHDALLASAGLEPDCTRDALAGTLAAEGIDAPAGADREALLDLLVGACLIPRLGHDAITFVHGYPVSQAALAAIDPGPPPRAARFEVFVDGLELGNGFRELTDPDEQRVRFDRERATRRDAGLHVPPMPEALLAALARGLPACAGVALGMDRIAMLASGADHIADVLPPAEEHDDD